MQVSKKEKKRIFIPVWTVILLMITLLLLHFAGDAVIKCFKAGTLLENFSNESVLSSETTIKQIVNGKEYGDYTEISKKLSELNPTHCEWTNINENPEESGFFCIATEDEGARMVYNIDQNNICDMGYTLKDFNYIWVDSVNQGFYCVINIPGEVVDLSGYYILVHDDTGNLASRLIINCFEAKAVKLNDTIVTGTVLAPNANVEYSKTIVYGGVYAKGSTGSRSFYKTIEFGGYDIIMDEYVKVSFTNYVVRSTIFKYLKEFYPGTYSTYPEDYQLTDKDLAKVYSLDLEGQLVAEFYNDLEYLVNLESINLKNTKLKSVDLSGLTKLKYVDISETDIASITLPDNSSIETFIADWSKLETLDTGNLRFCKHASFSRVPFVTEPCWENLICVEYLDITGTGFTGFNGTGYENLTKIKELYLSENENLTSIVLTGFTNLTKLEIRECGLKEIDVSGLTVLDEIDISYNSFKEADLSTCESLTKVSAYGSYKKIIVLSDKVSVSKLDDTKLEIIRKTGE